MICPIPLPPVLRTAGPSQSHTQKRGQGHNSHLEKNLKGPLDQNPFDQDPF